MPLKNSNNKINTLLNGAYFQLNLLRVKIDQYKREVAGCCINAGNKFKDPDKLFGACG